MVGVKKMQNFLKSPIFSNVKYMLYTKVLNIGLLRGNVFLRHFIYF